MPSSKRSRTAIVRRPEDASLWWTIGVVEPPVLKIPAVHFYGA
jgi:hypothetical protein